MRGRPAGGRDEPLGLIVDSVGEILSVTGAESPSGDPAPGFDAGLLSGALEVQGRRVFLPDLKRMMGGP